MTPAPKPKPPTQKQRVLQLLRSRERVTVRDIFQLGINSPTARISELRKDGYHIAHQDVTAPNQFGVNVEHREYWLVETK
ncbi:helix-turn-helix domain-containing protein [Alysiella filiformis]|uniref:Helix-turn-helix domain-containing protein n=1 Tax=Alysiella filiformis DSM 16848 TaxID=1120981 RepID=A0A286EDH2_9NEIS|nr:helix-turn-helix domain-containing protein [Alysiella filiformis]QMT31192.1 hypothetical protein H3L97_10855 [Alysiella filiformis]UBQ55813.1 helix-turn-helix domain-containing protein [Alysiella filiformis DSM 16848]SOD68909.1 Helix-turn-helix domain-containing protein [Alysiella filiformis DSM 16848]